MARVCIGYDLAVTEMRLCLALVGPVTGCGWLLWRVRCVEARRHVGGTEGDGIFQVAIKAVHLREGMPVQTVLADPV